ncbi:MAG: FAD/NAD(P)-binding protein [Ilumatobacteraceae bacterium]
MTLRVVIVGGGASGTLLAAQVLRKANSPIHVTVVEPRERLGEGVAFSTDFPGHLLNVRAKALSGLVEFPDDFVKWAGIDRDAFAPRALYAKYLRHVLDDARGAAANEVKFDHVQAAVASISSPDVGDGKGHEIRCLNGQVLESDLVVLATGNGPPYVPQWFSPEVRGHDRFIADPWAPDSLSRIRNGTVVTIGTGLTFIDVAVRVLENSPTNIIGISRHGLLPTRHTHVEHPPSVPGMSTPREVLHWLRQNRSNWRAAINGLRTRTQDLWMNFSPAQQRQFLRHAMRYWEIHRHRIATEVGIQIDGYLELERIQVVKSGVTGVTVVSPSSLTILTSTGIAITADWVVLCTSPTEVGEGTRSIISFLIDNGQAVVGPQGLGLQCNPRSGALIDSLGNLSTTIFTIGPLRRGMLWETTAIPEIHVQADQLGELISMPRT